MTPNNSSSLTEYFCSWELSLLEAYVNATQPLSVKRSRAAPTPKADASHALRASKFWLKCLFSVISDMSSEKSWNAVVCPACFVFI